MTQPQVDPCRDGPHDHDHDGCSIHLSTDGTWHLTFIEDNDVKTEHAASEAEAVAKAKARGLVVRWTDAERWEPL